MHTPSVQRVLLAYKAKHHVETRDGEKAVVYEYTDAHHTRKNREKADRVEGLRKDLPKLQAKYKKDLTSDDAKTRLTALAVALLDETYERVGNDGSAEENEHYGVTTWEKQHISFSGGKAKLKYTGKSGVDHEKEVTNPKVVSALKEAVKGKKPGERILCSTGDEDECTISAGDVNEYLSEFEITAKDMRGLHANEEMKTRLKAIRAKGPKLPSDKKEKEKLLKEEFKEALEGAAEAVGHSPSMLRSSYLVPGFEDQFMKDGTVLDKLSKKGYTREASLALLRDRFGLNVDKLARVLLPAGRWVESHGKDLDPDQEAQIWTCFDTSYRAIGMAYNEVKDLIEENPVLWCVDLDGDDSIDAFITYKRTPAGQKVTFLGCTGTQTAKSAVMRKLIELLGGSGWYLEGSHRLAEILDRAGTPLLDDEEAVHQILKKPIEWLGAGKYIRTITGIGPVQKSIYGKPRVGKTATKTESEKDEEDVERLIKPSPKLKPPRNDLARRDVQDTSSREKDPDKAQEAKDNPKPSKAASASRVALMYILLASVEKTDSGTFKATRSDGTYDYFDSPESANTWLSYEEKPPNKEDASPDLDSPSPDAPKDESAAAETREKELRELERKKLKEKEEKEVADPLFDADNPIPESSEPGNEDYSPEHREALVSRTMTAIERWRGLDSSERKEKAGLVETELEDLEDGDPRKEHLEAVLRGIRIGGAIADGDKAEGVGAAAVQLIRAADRSGDLADIAELGVIGSKTSGTSDDQAVIRRIYENLPSDEWVNVLPDKHPGRDLAELLADPVESRFLTPSDRLDISKMLMDMQVADLTFVDPAVSRNLPSGSTADAHGSEAKKLRLKAVAQPIERPKESGGVKKALSAMQDAIRKIIGMATKGETKHEPGDVWPKGGKFWGKAKDNAVQGFDSQADAAEFARSNPS